MTNLKKVGLSALAGSLVAFSANAVDMSVTGTAEVTYTTNGGSNSVTGNPWGSNTSVSFQIQHLRRKNTLPILDRSTCMFGRLFHPILLEGVPARARCSKEREKAAAVRSG